MLEMGPIEQNIVIQAQRARAPIPERIANAPVLQQGLELYIEAFFDLDSERQVGFSILPIPWRSIVNYAQVYGFDDEQREDLIFLVRKMDNAHIERLNKKTQNGKK